MKPTQVNGSGGFVSSISHAREARHARAIGEPGLADASSDAVLRNAQPADEEHSSVQPRAADWGEAMALPLVLRYGALVRCDFREPAVWVPPAADWGEGVASPRAVRYGALAHCDFRQRAAWAPRCARPADCQDEALPHCLPAGRLPVSTAAELHYSDVVRCENYWVPESPATVLPEHYCALWADCSDAAQPRSSLALDSLAPADAAHCASGCWDESHCSDAAG